MILCDECEKRIVAFLDGEGTEEDAELISSHLKECPECRAFEMDTARIRQAFLLAAGPGLPAVGREPMAEAPPDSLRREKSRRESPVTSQRYLRTFRRLAWAGALAGLCLVVFSCVRWFGLAGEVADLKRELRVARRDVAIFREQKQLEESQETQQKAISALQFRMGELMERLDRSYLPRTASLPSEGGRPYSVLPGEGPAL